MAVNVAKQSWLWVLLIIILLLLIFGWGSSSSTVSKVNLTKATAAARKDATRSAPEAFKPLVQKNVRAKNVWEPRVAAHQVVEEVEEFDEE